MSQHGPDLGEALEALRELGDGDGDPGTRDRVLDSLDRRGQRRRTITAFAVVLGLSFTGTTAWGWFSGWIPAMVRTIIDDAPSKVEPPQAAPQRKVVRREPAQAAAAPAPPLPIGGGPPGTAGLLGVLGLPGVDGTCGAFCARSAVIRRSSALSSPCTWSSRPCCSAPAASASSRAAQTALSVWWTSAVDPS